MSVFHQVTAIKSGSTFLLHLVEQHKKRGWKACLGVLLDFLSVLGLFFFTTMDSDILQIFIYISGRYVWAVIYLSVEA